MLTSNLYSIAIEPADSLEILSIISSLKDKSTCGLDQIPLNVVKAAKDIIAPIMALLINHSFNIGIFPNALKMANIKPIFKSGNQSELSNYRPISLLNSFSKIYEKASYNRLLKFIIKNDILYEKQFGF